MSLDETPEEDSHLAELLGEDNNFKNFTYVHNEVIDSALDEPTQPGTEMEFEGNEE